MIGSRILSHCVSHRRPVNIIPRLPPGSQPNLWWGGIEDAKEKGDKDDVEVNDDDDGRKGDDRYDKDEDEDITQLIHL